MWNFQRIICIWICCVSCMFGTTQLSTALVQAVPYEYFDDHDQSFYDLDTEQIQAKYDTRLLSQQMLPSSENLKGFHNSASFHTTNTLLNDDGSHRNTLEMRKQNDAAFMYGSTAKLKSNDGPADGDERNNNWLEQVEETATKAASSTSAFTESLDELHLPRAASCFTNGQKYTHGQKVPRLDNCEVCLCMDGEIFCWWEKCDKKPTKTLTTYDDYSTPFEESSTTRMQLSPKTTFKSTLKPMKKLKTTTTNEDYKYDDDDSAEIREMQQEYEGLKEQLAREEHAQEREREQEHEEVRMHEQHKNHNKQMMKKKIYQQQEEEKYNNKKIKEENQKQKQEMEPHRTQQQQKLKSNEHYEQHHHARNHNGNSRHRDNGSSGASSKILNFPENLPSVLYYDYKTEEHHQHQHQHREQHLKHQKQKQQQHEKELKQRQQQKLLQKQQLQQQKKQQKLLPIQRHHSNRHHEYGQVFHTYNLPDKSEELTELGNGGGGINGPSTTFKYFSNGNENIYNGGDLLSDSDILPEPPTKTPKILTTTADTTDMGKTTGTPLSQIYRLLTAATAPVTTMPLDKSSNTPTTTIIASTPLKKEILSSWDSNKPNNDKTNGNNKSNNNSNDNSDSKANRNNESTEDLMDTDDQDDAFHRWLTAPDTNNKNYFTFNESTSIGGVGGFDGTNSDYNGDERNYENIGFDSETGFSSASVGGDTKATINVMATGATKNIETAAASIYSDDAKANGMHENEQHFSMNNVHNGNYINMASSNGIINGNGNSYNNNNNNNNIVLPFSETYENFNRNNNLFGSSTTSTSGGSAGNSNESGGGGVGIIGSTVSNEDNGVASVVNIDIMLTASSAELQQQQLQPTNIQTTNQQQQQQEQHFEHEKQIGKTPNEFMQPPSVLISNKNDVSVVDVGVGAAAGIALVKNNTLFSKINDNSSSSGSGSSNNSNNMNFTNILGGNQNIETQNWGVNLSNNNSNGNTNNNNNNSATSYSSSSSSDSFKFKHLPTVLVSQTNATSSTATALVASAIPPTLSTTSSPERQCNVMGTLYKIGDVLPQDTGNCLQCICIDGSTSDDTPRVTCSPHNCPPLVLPDLFDATGY